MTGNNNRKFYDEAFLEIFTNKTIVKSMLRDFIKEEWVNLIDFSSMKEERSVFKGISDSKRESDLLLTFQLKKTDQPERARRLSMYILIEFQSTSKTIILRLLEYLLKIYKKQLKENSVLYPVIPIVIYNGTGKWTEKNNLREHFALFTWEVSKYLPVFEYVLIDIVRFDDKLLEKLKGAAATFFLLDKTDLTERKEAEKRIIRILNKLIHANPEIYTLLGRYVSELFHYKGLEIPVVNEYINERGESMLAQSLDKLYEQGLEKGIEQGIELERHETAVRMLSAKADIAFISQVTGLSMEAIQRLKQLQ